MVFSIGIIGAVLAKRYNKGRSRLKLFRQGLKKLPRSQIVLYQFPLKMIFSILMLITLGYALQYFYKQYSLEMKALNSQEGHLNIYSINYHQNQSQTIIQDNYQEHQDDVKVRQVRYTVSIIQYIITIVISILSLNLSIKHVKVSRNDVRITNISHLGFSWLTKHYEKREDDTLIIRQVGQERFTNTNFYFSIRVSQKEGQLELMKKSSIFHSRKTIIQIGQQLSLPYSTKIKPQLS